VGAPPSWSGPFPPPLVEFPVEFPVELADELLLELPLELDPFEAEPFPPGVWETGISTRAAPYPSMSIDGWWAAAVL
jgi:hypothetical protein